MKIFKNIGRRMDESSNWIMNAPESLSILLLMGTSMASLFFSALSITMFFNRKIFLGLLFAFFVFGAGSQFIKIFKLSRKVGLKGALGGYTANEFVWKRNKHGGKINGTSRYKGDEICDEQDDRRNGKIGKEVRDIYR